MDDYDYSFEIILIGDSGVGKTSLIASFISDSNEPPQSTNDHMDLKFKQLTVGDTKDHMDLKFKLLTVGDTKLLLTIWDTIGQDKYRTVTESFYRDADGVILVYDITDRSSFTAISDFWAKEVELRTNNPDCVKMLVGNKVDRNSERTVSREEGITLAKGLQCSFFESSAKTKENVKQCFETLARQIMEVPGLEEVEEEEEEEEEEESPGEMRHLQTVQCCMMAHSDNLGRGRGRRHGRRRRRHRPRRPPQLLALPPPPPPPRSHASGECSCN